MKWFKRLHSSVERAKLREALAHGEYDKIDAVLERWNEWSSPRDGKWFVNKQNMLEHPEWKKYFRK
jgi:hypothetical protein